VLGLRDGTIRLSRLKERLPGISSAVLDAHVQRLAELGVLTRERFREMPPRVELTLTETGRELLPSAEALARWGMRRMWSSPSTGERVDVAGLLALLPILLGDCSQVPDGTAALTVVTPGGTQTQLLTAERGSVRLADDQSHIVNATAEGEQPDWVAALGPSQDLSALHISGDRALITGIFAALARAA
jgi:DNA-binding HxlR family transcriptional regulator